MSYKKGRNLGGLESGFPVLLTKVECLHNSSVSLDVGSLEVIKHLTTFTDKALHCALGTVVFLVSFQVTGKVSDTVGKQSNLALWRSSVYIRLSVLTENLLLFVCVQIF